MYAHIICTHRYTHIRVCIQGQVCVCVCIYRYMHARTIKLHEAFGQDAAEKQQEQSPVETTRLLRGVEARQTHSVMMIQKGRHNGIA